MIKMILKICVLPVLLGVNLLCILGKLLTNISSYVVGLLFLLFAGCAIFCIVKAMWTSLAILAVMGLAVFVAIFALVWIVVKAETFSEFLGAFLHS